MPLPSWPIATYKPDPDSFQPIQRFLDPLETPMEGGNTRMRARPGDNVGTIQQTIWMSFAEYNMFTDWVKNTLNNGTARFTANVWLGTAYVSKTCQFIKPGTMLKAAYFSVDKVVVPMKLRIYGV